MIAYDSSDKEDEEHSWIELKEAAIKKNLDDIRTQQKEHKAFSFRLSLGK